jgi:DNA (cytosine-5)-methyltransferase 1
VVDGAALFSCLQAPPRPPRARARRRREPDEEIDVDLFCGGGGVSEAFVMATGKSPALALNHSPAAILMHQANHRDTIHLRADIDAVRPRAVVGKRRVRILWASPQCTHFSKARGSAPKSVQQREQGWSVVRWARDVQPRIILCENVEEWLTWGPLHPDDHPDEDLRGQPIAERAGETWAAWVQALRELDYVVEWRLLTACDFGAPTSRERLFVVARRDGAAIAWPDPTHGPADSEAVRAGLLAAYVPAADQIDWSIPMCSIFATREEAKAWKKETGAAGVPQRPLAPATMNRLAEGMLRFVLGERRPFVVNLSHGGRLEDLNEPANTITATPAGGDRCLVSPFVAKAHANGSDRPGSGIRHGGEPLGTNTTTEQFAVAAAHLSALHTRSVGSSVEAPAPTITGHAHEALVAAGLVNTRNGEREGQAPRVRDLAEPAPTITAQGSQGAVAAAWVVRHNGTTPGKLVAGSDAAGPLPTVCTKLTQGVGAAFVEKLYSSASAGQPAEDPLSTVSTGGGRGGGHHAAVHAALERVPAPPELYLSPGARDRARKVVAFLTAYYGEGGTSAAADGPAPTITTKARLGLVTVTVVSADGVSVEDLCTVTIDGVLWVIVDIAMRMLTPRELARCQGFPESYILTGTKAEQIERIGNSVSPHPAAALIAANLGMAPPVPVRRAA